MSTKPRSVVIQRNKGTAFPLYSKLFEESKKIKVPDTKVWAQISKMDRNNAEIIYYLILHYARLHQNNDEVPYVRKIPEGGRGVIYDVELLPLELQLILTACVHEITAD